MRKLKKILEAFNGKHKAANKELERRLNLPENDSKRILPDDFSLAEIWEATVGPIRETLDPVEGIREDVNVTQFTLFTKTLLSKKIMDAYEAKAKVGDSLVTKFPSKLLIDKVPGGYVSGNLAEIEAGMPYEHPGDVTDKYVQIEGKKRGAIIDVTWEAVYFDQTGIVMREAQKFGERAAVDREQQIVNRIQDIAAFRCYYPTNTQTNIYQAAGAARHTYGNLINDALQNWRDIDAAYQALAAMKDDNGDPITIKPSTLLVPMALETVARRLIANTLMPATRTGGGTVGDSMNEANPWANRFQVISSPYLDDQSTVVWYLGNFKKQFLYKEVLPLQVLSRLDEKNDAAWDRDILMQYKVRYYGIVGAIDYRFVVKSSGTMGQCEHDSVCGAGSFS